MKITKPQAETEARALWDYLRERYASDMRASLIDKVGPDVLAGVDILLASEEVAAQARAEIAKQLLAGKVPRGGYRTLPNEPTEPTPTVMSQAEVLAAIKASFPTFVRELCAQTA